MKGAQERLEANNRKKEEFFTMQKNKKEQAILEQSEIGLFLISVQHPRVNAISPLLLVVIMLLVISVIFWHIITINDIPSTVQASGKGRDFVGDA